MRHIRMKGKVAALDLDRPSDYGEEQSVAAGPACETLRGTKPTMPIELKMPALSPTMEEGTLAKWLVKEGDEVKSGDLLAEIETDKATMEFEAVDEGTVAKIVVPEGSDGVKPVTEETSQIWLRH